MQLLLQVILGPNFASLRLFLCTMCGALALYLFSLTKGFQGSVPVLKKLLPGHEDVFYNRIDFVIVIVLGSIIGTLFFVPSNPPQALAAGFGWVSGVNILTAPDSAKKQVLITKESSEHQ